MVVDTTYANYRRLSDILLVPINFQVVSLDWHWMKNENREAIIQRLMNLTEVRDKPESESGTEVAW